MILLYYYSDDLCDSDIEKFYLYGEDINLKPFWIIFDTMDQFISFWKDNKDKIIIVDFYYWDNKERIK